MEEQQPDSRDFAADVRDHINDFLIPKYENNMPFRLADTYTGLILERSEIVSLLKLRRDYDTMLADVVTEAQQLSAPIGPQFSFERPMLDRLDAFIAEFLAYAMFSHRWRDREPTLQDVRKATNGIYSMDDKDLLEGNPKANRNPQRKQDDLPTGVQKLQEFCCLAAKCGFRWAWTDTCCINKKDYAETSESINCMFLWYRCSELTIVYLDDVDDVEDGRLPALKEDESGDWFQDPEIKAPLRSSQSSASPSPSDIYIKDFPTEPYISLHDYLLTSPPLRSMQPDTQVERPQLEDHLIYNFPSDQDCKDRGQHRMPPVWVGRGWTLQEMVASKRLRFYSKRWTLLEEAEDRDTSEAEEKICISSFKYRARLVDHRANDMWGTALEKTTLVPQDDLVKFRPGTRDVRSRLIWAARRRTTKVEDRAYCLLGIFDVSLPAIYGEGTRAFFRLQEELMKRTGDVSLFDWCGRSASVNSFLAYDPRCFMLPNIPEPEIPDSTDKPYRMILDLFCRIMGTTLSIVGGAIQKAINVVKDWVLNIMKSPPPGHTLVNGELNISLFEHQVKHCKRVESTTPGDGYHYYELVAHGLMPTRVTFMLHSSSLVNHPTQYYLCRVWDRRTKDVFQILLDLIKYFFEEVLTMLLPSSDSKPEGDCADGCATKDEENADGPQSRLEEEIQAKRKQVLQFFENFFPVCLVRVEDGRRVRVSTVNRVEAKYTKFDFTMPLVTRLIL